MTTPVYIVLALGHIEAVYADLTDARRHLVRLRAHGRSDVSRIETWAITPVEEPVR